MLGAKHIDVATSYNNLGVVHQALAELEQAKDYHQRALEIRINVLDAKYIDVATSYNNLGWCTKHWVNCNRLRIMINGH